MRLFPSFTCLLLLVVSPQLHAQRGDWFNEAKFGLFIHWGIYAVPAGVYHNQAVERSPGHAGTGEWIMHDARIPVSEYAQYAHVFDPTKFNADEWVHMARDAGMRYIVITAKHHDGFAMFKSTASSFNVVDDTPFARDPLKELAIACQKAGIRLGFYYSQAQDWHHPGGAAWKGSGAMTGGDPEAGHWDPAQAGDFDQYLATIAVPQVKELLSNYGPVAILWWDTPIGMTPERAASFEPLLKLQPKMLTNNRLLDPDHPNSFSGDTETPEQTIPASGMKNRRFEVCMTMNDTWGFKAQDQNWKSADDIIKKLVDIASKGGNFLLNVGPTAEGEFPGPCVDRLRACGRWLRANHEAVYGTTASLFRQLPWGRSTTRGAAVYLEVFDWPKDGDLVVPGVRTNLVRASLLASGVRLPTKRRGQELVVSLPEQAVDPIASVIKLEFEERPIVEQPLPGQDSQGSIVLPAALAVIVNAYAGNARLEGSGGGANIAHWNKAGIAACWNFRCDRPGTYLAEVEVLVSCPTALEYGPSGSNKRAERLSGTTGKFTWEKLGTLSFARAGEQKFCLRTADDDAENLAVRNIRLSPMPSL